MGKVSWGSSYTKSTIVKQIKPKKKTTTNNRLDYPNLIDRGLRWETARTVVGNGAGAATTYINFDGQIMPQPPVTDRPIIRRPLWRIMADQTTITLNEWVANIAETIAEEEFDTVQSYLDRYIYNTFFIECCDNFEIPFGDVLVRVQDEVENYRELMRLANEEAEEDDDEEPEDYEPVF